MKSLHMPPIAARVVPRNRWNRLIVQFPLPLLQLLAAMCPWRTQAVHRTIEATATRHTRESDFFLLYARTNTNIHTRTHKHTHQHTHTHTNTHAHTHTHTHARIKSSFTRVSWHTAQHHKRPTFRKTNSTPHHDDKNASTCVHMYMHMMAVQDPQAAKRMQHETRNACNTKHETHATRNT
jgi:hypothetical protein